MFGNAHKQPISCYDAVLIAILLSYLFELDTKSKAAFTPLLHQTLLHQTLAKWIIEVCIYFFFFSLLEKLDATNDSIQIVKVT